MKPFALLWLLALATAAECREAPLPRVTLTAPALSVADACEQIGRQINRRFGSATRAAAPPARLVAWNLRDATVGEALTAIEDAAGCRLRRAGYAWYLLDSSRPLTGVIGQRVGGFHIWLPRLEYTWQSWSLYSAGPPTKGVGYLWPRFEVEAPDDPSATRVLGCARAVAQTSDGETLATPTDPPGYDDAYTYDPRVRSFNPYLPGPRLDGERLARLGFELTLATKLRGSPFTFDLPLAKEQTQSDGEFDVVLRPRAVRRDGRPESWQLTVTPPAPPPGQSGRAWWVEPRLSTADGQTLYVDWARDDGSHRRLTQTTTFTVQRAPVDANRAAAQLEVVIWSPGEATTTETVAFETVPLPPLRDTAGRANGG